MHHHKFAIAMAGVISFAMPSSTLAQTSLSLAQKEDMACYVGLSILGRDAQNSPKMNATAKQNIASSIFYYAGKIAARYPGKAVASVVNSHIKDVNEYIKSTNAKKCLDEVKTALAPGGTK